MNIRNANRWLPLASLALLATPLTLLAHHGTAGTYDQKKLVKVTGVVKEFRWRNPHCALLLTGKDAAGAEVTYSFEIGSPNSLVRRGFNRDAFKVGDTVSLEYHPAFNNPNVGNPESKTFVVNGKPLTGMGESNE